MSIQFRKREPTVPAQTLPASTERACSRARFRRLSQPARPSAEANSSHDAGSGVWVSVTPPRSRPSPGCPHGGFRRA